MKRKLICLFLSIVLIFTMSLTAAASESLYRIVDDAGLLDTAEDSALEEKARLLREEYEMDIVILTVNSLDGMTPQEYADDYYDGHGYGCGENASGVLLLLSIEERDWYISTRGEAVYALTDFGIQQLGEEMVSVLGVSYYGGFNYFLDALPEYFDAYKNGAPIDGYADYSGDYYHGDQEEIVYYEEELSPSFLLSLIIGVLTSGITVLIMRFSMNTKRPQRCATAYMQHNSFQLRQKQDLFLYRNVTKSRRQENKSSGGGGGSSVHRSSGGNRHGGGGGKF